MRTSSVCPCPCTLRTQLWLRVGEGSAALPHGRPPLDERSRAFLGVVAAKDRRLELGLQLPASRGAGVDRGLHDPLRRRYPERTVGRYHLGEGERFVEHPVGGNDTVDEADGRGALRVDGVARQDQLEGQ